ncbi:flagellar protein FliT [Clostridium botulinum]|uniref:flagellar protein FliT n=1 Tax=Clostridium botulinum TaxID=1491 RepID=UPI00068FCC4C|nr:flagellar protein FliT [Clostridium botulinum]MCD3232826.1 flagellar protein FliT [Clostridium botulinum D/C]MCD3238688.1 flagellar protein FliT [Clostridium botulinum D/C]MCD3266236.1 flagellar protein FliT [Clostridium botulinum D/C]MCD3300470.1 flagellar protein FliT [Clostridium botulinum D/C]MCD3304475.1 flagellar protein FliT [Clostridium botulinum D/C]
MLYEFLKEYRDLNMNIINALNDDNIDLVEELLNKKDKLIKKIETIEYSKQEFKKIVLDLKLNESEKMLNQLSMVKKQEYRKEINSINKGKNANRIYGNTRKNIFLEKFI